MNSGMKIFRSPVSSRSFKLTLGFGLFIILQNSSWNLSIEMDFVFLITSSSANALNVSSSILNPSWPANLMARTGLSPSSVKRSVLFPTVRMIFFLISLLPWIFYFTGP